MLNISDGIDYYIQTGHLTTEEGTLLREIFNNLSMYAGEFEPMFDKLTTLKLDNYLMIEKREILNNLVKKNWIDIINGNDIEEITLYSNSYDFLEGIGYRLVDF